MDSRRFRVRPRGSTNSFLDGTSYSLAHDEQRLEVAHLSEMRVTLSAAQTTPTNCCLTIRSSRTTRARATVAAGYSDVMTATSDRRPARVAQVEEVRRQIDKPKPNKTAHHYRGGSSSDARNRREHCAGNEGDPRPCQGPKSIVVGCSLEEDEEQPETHSRPKASTTPWPPNHNRAGVGGPFAKSGSGDLEIPSRVRRRVVSQRQEPL